MCSTKHGDQGYGLTQFPRSLRVVALEERLQVLLLVVQEVNLFLALPLIHSAALSLTPLNGFALVLEFHDAGLQLLLLLLVFGNHLLRLGLPLLRLELLPGAERDTALVESLVGCDGHADFIPHPEEQ